MVVGGGGGGDGGGNGGGDGGDGGIDGGDGGTALPTSAAVAALPAGVAVAAVHEAVTVEVIPLKKLCPLGKLLPVEHPLLRKAVAQLFVVEHAVKRSRALGNLAHARWLNSVPAEQFRQSDTASW